MTVEMKLILNYFFKKSKVFGNYYIPSEPVDVPVVYSFLLVCHVLFPCGFCYFTDLV